MKLISKEELFDLINESKLMAEKLDEIGDYLSATLLDTVNHHLSQKFVATYGEDELEQMCNLSTKKWQ